MGAMKGLKKLAVTLACLVVVMFSMVACAPSAPTEPTPEIKDGAIKNVILLIGDGFGPNHLINAKKYFDIDKFAFEDDYVCDVTTYSANDAVTDSAAAASALATGQKFNNGEVGYHNFQDVKNIMEYAQEHNMKTGVITSDTLHGATPAGFSAHTNSRHNASEIVDDQIKSGVDLLVGAYANDYDDWLYMAQNGYQHQSNKINAVKNLQSDEKCFAMFTDLKPSKNYVDFPELIKDSLNFLDNENGFCCMIENANIDKYSHNNDFENTMQEVLYFAQMIEAVYEFVAGRDDTVVLITADHETGGLQVGQTKDELNSSLFTSGGVHTATDVHLWIKFPQAPAQVNYKTKIDNTDIFKICHKIVTEGVFDQSLISAVA